MHEPLALSEIIENMSRGRGGGYRKIPFWVGWFCTDTLSIEINNKIYKYICGKAKWIRSYD